VMKPTVETAPKSTKRYSALMDQLPHNPASTPPPTVQPVFAAEVEAASDPFGEGGLEQAGVTPHLSAYPKLPFKVVKAAPPVTKNSQLLLATPRRPRAVDLGRVLLCRGQQVALLTGIC
jgi:hypothetical protein